jgi:hypothetical protein
MPMQLRIKSLADGLCLALSPARRAVTKKVERLHAIGQHRSVKIEIKQYFDELVPPRYTKLPPGLKLGQMLFISD